MYVYQSAIFVFLKLLTIFPWVCVCCLVKQMFTNRHTYRRSSTCTYHK